jgi:4-aminobutyrate aminotransferase/(S)-3-amino-2-methylpropionate transaminase
MIGVELVKPGGREPDPEAFPFIAEHARDHGLLILDCGPFANVIRFIPPLCVTTDEIDTAVDVIDSALSAYEAR